MKKFGFLRVGAVVPEVKVANVDFNIKEIIKQIKKAYDLGVKVLVFPELSITSCTCADLFYQDVLISKSIAGLKEIVDGTKEIDIISIVGMPLKVDNQLFDVAVVINKGNILGIVPKVNFEEIRGFATGLSILSKEIELLGQKVYFGTNILFRDKDNSDFCFGIELGEDLSALYSPSISHVLNGATVIFNLSASNVIVGRNEYINNLVKMQSSKLKSAYVYVSAGALESTTDLVFDGNAVIAENGHILKEGKRFCFESNITVYDIDVKRVMSDRYKNVSYMNVFSEEGYVYITVDIKDSNKIILREYDKYPFVPSDSELVERCNEIINIQACSLAKRLKHINVDKTVIGISGGLDSTLAFLVIVKAYEKLGISNKNIIAITMPGFGTTNRTYNNAVNLVKNYGATLREISVKDACLQHFKDIGHDIDIHDVTYENAQARERTQILMDVANKENALVVGTGDLSELALGWCTYNGDHISMYSVNGSIPKTLVKHLVKYVADIDGEENKKIIYDILDTPISPELLPPDKKGDIKQKTEDTIGPYILHDFFLYHFLRYGASPSKILELAKNTFDGDYDVEEIKKWLEKFVKRFFTQQFKRSCLPDGPKVGTIGISPRGDLKMPSDADFTVWVDDLK